MAVFRRKIAEAASCVARQNDAEKLARQRALATARQQKRRTLKKAAKASHALVTDPGIEHVDVGEEVEEVEEVELDNIAPAPRPHRQCKGSKKLQKTLCVSVSIAAKYTVKRYKRERSVTNNHTINVRIYACSARP